MEDKNQPLRPDKTGTSTSSLGEIEHFSRLAAEWWNPEGSFKSLHQINPIRMAYLCDQICLHFDRKRNHFRSLENLSILDVGCGGGLICEPLARLGANVTGIDGAEESIGVASHHANMMSLNISYQRRLPEELAAKDKQYDILVNMEVIEHVADAKTFVVVCETLLKPGGLMVTSTLNRTIQSLVLAKIMAEYILKWVPAGTHDWRKFIKPSEIGRYFRDSGLVVSDITGMQVDLIEGSWNFSKNLGINYFITAVKPK